MAKIRNKAEFEAWLNDKPREWAQALSARIALRVLPFIYSPKIRFDLTKAVCRALFISACARSYPHAEMTQAAADAAADAAAYAAADAAADAAAYAAAYAAADAAAYAADAAADAAAYAARAAAAAYAAAYAADAAAAAYAADAAAYAAYAADIWESIESDAIWLEGQTSDEAIKLAQALMNRPLWPSDVSKDILENWGRLKSQLLGANQDWDIWVDWYENRLTGGPIAFSLLPIPYDTVTPEIATETNEFWERDPAIINAEIKARLLAAVTPPLPHRPVASVKPIWRNDILVQDDGVTSQASKEDIEAMQAALGLDFSELAEDLSQDANIAPKALVMMRRSADQLNQKGLSRADIFRLINRLIELQLYGATVREEWSPEDSARYHALILQLDGLLKTYPEVRDYLASLPKTERTVADIEALLEAEDTINVALKSNIAKPVIDPSVPEAMEEATADVLGDLGPLRKDYYPKAALASVENQISGMGAVLQPLLERAQKSLMAEAEGHADKTGAYSTTLLVYLFNELKKVSKAVAVSGASLGVIHTTQIDVLINASPQLAALIAVLSFIVLGTVDKKKKDSDNDNDNDNDKT
jgi:hypothetical protein